MLRVKLKVGTGPSLYTDTNYGFIYLDSDKRVGPESKGFEKTSYPEQEGENIIPKTVDAPFDYKVKFFVQSDSLHGANEKIVIFNNSLYEQVQGSSVKTFKKVEFYNYYKRHKIVGYPQEIPLATDYWHDTNNQVNDVVVVEWTIRVTKPSECDFNLSNQE